EKFEIAYAISLITQIGITVSFITILFIGLGYKVDKYLGTLPIFVILGAVLAFVLSMFAVYRLVLPIVKKKREEDKPASVKKD
ncbi:MAG: AtpZ/AtpI family protein, partial [Candidatus Pacebacteria bacterium]|nr:AtpZ/AtpI family protein [Candidatus Paceibacterota bacterium]